MVPMAEHVTIDKSSALEQLYSRITRIAEDMGGTASRTSQSLGFPAAMVETPRREHAPALRVEMPDGFQLDFAPFLPLSAPGNALSVTAKRTYGESRKNDWTFSFANGEWKAHSLVSDDTIRACLTAEGPKPAVY
jgi:hypothetical protein